MNLRLCYRPPLGVRRQAARPRHLDHLLTRYQVHTWPELHIVRRAGYRERVPLVLLPYIQRHITPVSASHMLEQLPEIHAGR